MPEDKGRLVTAFLESFFGRYVEYDFTADLEEQLDRVSNARDRLEAGAARLLERFLRSPSTGPRNCAPPTVLDTLNDLLGPHIFPAKGDGAIRAPARPAAPGQLSLKLGKFGAFIGCSNYPECKFTRTLSPIDGEASPRATGPA